jgi:hypothetical protein
MFLLLSNNRESQAFVGLKKYSLVNDLVYYLKLQKIKLDTLELFGSVFPSLLAINKRIPVK